MMYLVLIVLLLAAAALLSGIGVCRLRLLGLRTHKRSWVLAYGGITIYSAWVVLHLLYLPDGPLKLVELYIHLGITALLLAFVLLQSPRWHQPHQADHAPPESDRTPLGLH